jgi:signal transduction histidine kinase
MTVARKLQSALIIFVVLITVVVGLHVRAIRSAAEGSRALADIAARQRVTSTDQIARLAQMRNDAEKFLITRDTGYLDRVMASSQVFSAELDRLRPLELTRSERSALVRLAVAWRSVSPMAGRLVDLPARPTAVGEMGIARFQRELDGIEAGTLALGAASQAAMTEELRSIEATARAAERISLTAAIVSLVLMIAVSTHLVRSILGPLGRLAEGTRQVSAGHFAHRLDTGGDDELAGVARDFNSMTARLGELDAMKRDFIAKVSHDLKTPLSSMQETTMAVLDGVAGPLSETQHRLLTLQLESSRRLSSMLSKLLDLSRLEARLVPTPVAVDLAQVIAGSVSRVHSKSSDLRVQVMEASAAALVHGDPHGLGQVIDNLLENALKFSPPGGTVVIRVATNRAEITVSVADEGPGIPDSEKERVFERFYQGEAGRAARNRGAGLGLAICREILTAHGGKIWITNNTPRGSVFSLSLPSEAVEQWSTAA